MSQSMELSSSIFEVNRESEELDVNKHFFKEDLNIIPEDGPKKVIFGPMEQEQRSIYQIISPYMNTIAKTTGNFAYEAGSKAYEYIKQGFWWFYDQMTNNVIPYTKQELPKLIFIISNKVTKKQEIIKSGDFCVLQMDEEDFLEINRKKQKQKQGPIQVLVPLGEYDQALIDEIKRNYVVSRCFPIDDQESQSQNMSMTYCIPSERFQVMEQSVKETLRGRSKMIQVHQLKQDEMKEKQKTQENKVVEKKLAEINLNGEKQLEEGVRKQSGQWQQPTTQELKISKPKAILLPDACLFIYEKTDEMYPFLLDELQNDPYAVAGHLVDASKLQKKESKDNQGSGEVPLLTVDTVGERIIVKKEKESQRIEEKPMQKVVDMERKVRVEINTNTQHQIQRKQQRELVLN